MQYLLPKLLYVCLFGVLGSAIPYLSLFYSDNLHLTSQQIGIILAIAPFVQSLACPFWTIQVDKRPYLHGILMAILMLIGGLSVITLMFIPKILPSSSVMIATISLAISFAFFGQPVTVLVDSAVLKILGDNKIYYGDQRLWGSISNGVCILIVGYLIGMFGTNSAFYVFSAGVVGFIIVALFTSVSVPEDIGVEETETDPLLPPPMLKDRPRNYYHNTSSDDGQRSFRNDYLSEEERRNSTASSSYANTLFFGSDQSLLKLKKTSTSVAVCDARNESNLLLDQMNNLPPLGLALSNIPSMDISLAAFANIQGGGITEEETTSLKATIFKSPKVWTFLCMTLLFGIFYSMVAQFLFLFLKQDLGLDSSVIGWTGPIGGVTEVTTFYISRILLKNFSVGTLVTVSHIAVVVRNLVYKTLTPGQPITLVLALAMQLINGFSYAMIWSTCVSEVDQMFPSNQRAIAQGILAALFSGLGFGIGCILGGYAYDHYSIQMLLDISISIAILSLIVFWFGRMFKSSFS